MVFRMISTYEEVEYKLDKQYIHAEHKFFVSHQE